MAIIRCRVVVVGIYSLIYNIVRYAGIWKNYDDKASLREGRDLHELCYGKRKRERELL